MSGTDIVLLESNHDIDMLHANDHYSAQLKARILGRYGHLSNEACGEALLQLYQTGVRHAVLGHLSHENNTPELAMSTVCGVLRAHGLEPKRLRFVASSAENAPSLALVEARRGGKAGLSVEPMLFIGSADWDKVYFR